MAHAAGMSKGRRPMRSLPALGCLAAVLSIPPLVLAAEAVAPKRFEPGLVSTGFDDAHVSFSPDGQTLYFLRSSPDFAHWTVLVSRPPAGRGGRRRSPPSAADG